MGQLKLLHNNLQKYAILFIVVLLLFIFIINDIWNIDKNEYYFIYITILFFMINIIVIGIIFYFNNINTKLFHKLKHSNELLEVIRCANQVMIQIKDPTLMIKNMTTVLTTNKHICTAAWIALSDEKDLLNNIVGSDESKEFLSFKSVIKDSPIPSCLCIINAKNPLVIQPTPENCDLCKLNHSYIDKNSILIRLVYKEKIYGIMGLSLKEEYLYSKNDHNLLLEVADDIAFALHSSDLESQLLTNEIKFENIFENSEVAIWHEDLTQISKIFKHLRLQGVTDIRKYLVENPKVTNVMANSIKILDINSATLKLFGATTRESFFAKVNGNFGLHSVNVFTEGLCAIWEKKDIFRSEANFLSFDGRELNTIVSFKIPKTQDAFATVPVTILDITDLKKAEKKQKSLATIIDESLNEIYIFEKNILKFIYANKGALKNLGYTQEELSQLNALDIKPNISPEEFFNITCELQNNNEKKVFFSTNHQRKNGTTYPVDIYLQSITHMNTEVYLAIIIDTSERELNKKEIRNKEEIMIAQSRHAAMGEMIEMIAHQWRQPLSVIAMGVNNLTLDIDFNNLNEENSKKELEIILKQTEHLSKTIDDFRNFFRPDKEIEEVKLKDVINEAKKIIGKSLSNENISLSIQQDNNYVVKTYSRELLQVYINLLNNAKEALVDNKIKNRSINISVSQNVDYVVTTFTDNGGGIGTDIINKIFDPYFSTKNAKNGTGLGLYISKIIIEKHLNGKINLSNTNNGACFKVSIPIQLEREIS